MQTTLGLNSSINHLNQTVSLDSNTCDEYSHAGQGQPGQIRLGRCHIAAVKHWHDVEIYPKRCSADSHGNTFIRIRITSSSSHRAQEGGHKKQNWAFAKDTWDGEEDFPSSFVHDDCGNSCKDDLDQTHKHRCKVTVLKRNQSKM